MDSYSIRMQMKRLVNDPAMNNRHRRVVTEALRIMDLMNTSIENYKELEDLFETNERLQTVLAEELEKQAQ